MLISKTIINWNIDKWIMIYPKKAIYNESGVHLIVE